MTKLQEKAQGKAKRAVGQIVGNDKLVVEGKKQERHADHASGQQAQPKEKDHAKNVEKGAAQKPGSAEKTAEPTGRKGPLLE
jgi:uncharacterized protein YjbJ (UPF0337 family)